MNTLDTVAQWLVKGTVLHLGAQLFALLIFALLGNREMSETLAEMFAALYVYDMAVFCVGALWLANRAKEKDA